MPDQVSYKIEQRDPTAEEVSKNSGLAGKKIWIIKYSNGQSFEHSPDDSKEDVRKWADGHLDKINNRPDEAWDIYKYSLGQGILLSKKYDQFISQYQADKAKEGQVESAGITGKAQTESADITGKAQVASSDITGKAQVASSESSGVLQLYGNALNTQAQLYQTAGGIFGAQIKPSLDALTDLTQKAEDKTIDRGSYVAKKDIYQYLEALDIAPKIDIDLSNVTYQNGKGFGTVTTSTGTVIDLQGQLDINELKMIRGQTDFSKINVDHTLITERKSNGKSVESESDPVDLYFVPREVKEAKFASMGVTSPSLIDGDMIHNVESYKKVKAVEIDKDGNYYYKDDNNVKIYVNEEDVYAKYKLSGIALVGDKDSDGSEKGNTNDLDVPLNSIFVRKKKGFHTTFHEQPDNQQRLFDLVFKDEDLNQRKVRAGLFNGFMESHQGLAGLIKLVMSLFPDLLDKFAGKKHKHKNEVHNNIEAVPELPENMGHIIELMPADVKPELQQAYILASDDKVYSPDEKKGMLDLVGSKGNLSAEQLQAADKVINGLAGPSIQSVAAEFKLSVDVPDVDKPKVQKMASEISQKANELFVDGKISDADKKEILNIIQTYGYKDVSLDGIKFNAPDPNNHNARINLYDNGQQAFKVAEITLH